MYRPESGGWGCTLDTIAVPFGFFGWCFISFIFTGFLGQLEEIAPFLQLPPSQRGVSIFGIASIALGFIVLVVVLIRFVIQSFRTGSHITGRLFVLGAIMSMVTILLINLALFPPNNFEELVNGLLGYLLFPTPMIYVLGQ